MESMETDDGGADGDHNDFHDDDDDECKVNLDLYSILCVTHL